MRCYTCKVSQAPGKVGILLCITNGDDGPAYGLVGRLFRAILETGLDAKDRAVELPDDGPINCRVLDHPLGYRSSDVLPHTRKILLWKHCRWPSAREWHRQAPSLVCLVEGLAVLMSADDEK